MLLSASLWPCPIPASTRPQRVVGRQPSMRTGQLTHTGHSDGNLLPTVRHRESRSQASAQAIPGAGNQERATAGLPCGFWGTMSLMPTLACLGRAGLSEASTSLNQGPLKPIPSASSYRYLLVSCTALASLVLAKVILV